MRRAIPLAGVALALLLAASGAGAEPETAAAPAGSPEERVAEILGPSFAAMPPWQQRLVLARYEQWRRLPEGRRARLTGTALVRFLTRPRRPFDERRLPAPLKEELARLPRETRPAAARLAVLRLRQIRLDRALARVPADRRWELFRALFPEPFEPGRVREAHRELRRHVVRSTAAEVMRLVRERREDGREERSPEEVKARKRELARQLIEREEQRVVERVRREIRRLRRRPERARRVLAVERLRYLTPRQRELVRYSLRPRECPLIDLSFLGPRPEGRREARVWEHDYRLFARLELLHEAGLPRELVLHLAPSGSAEELVRSLRAVFRPRPLPPEAR